MKSILALTLAGVALSAPAPAAAPPSFKIKNVVSGGSGCPQGSIDINFSDSALMPIYFSRDFTATVGPNAAADQSRKNCQINMSLQYSPGWSYAVYSADYTGYAALDSGVNGVVKSTYYFSGQTDQASSTMKLSGPTSGVYKKHDDVELSVWSPCSGDSLFNVNAEVALTPTTGGNSGTIAAIKESSRFTNSLYIKWRQC